MNVRQALRFGAAALPRRDGLPDPKREAAWLLAAVLGVDELRLRLEPERILESADEQRFREWVTRRAKGEPAHHLTGWCSFWNRRFTVSPAVLVPRPETEYLIEAALALPLPAEARVLDVGCGSGCIPLTLAAERPRWRVAAVDRSLPALAVARFNRAHLDVEINLLCGDLGSALLGNWHLVTANLPYVPSSTMEGLPIEVRHDPPLALDGGRDGLELIRRLLADCSRLLTTDGWCILEIGEDQADPVAALARESGLVELRRIGDAGGCERIVVLRNGG